MAESEARARPYELPPLRWPDGWPGNYLKANRACVVGELVGDPHVVTTKKLRERAEAAGLHFERRVRSPLGFFARFASASRRATMV